MIEVQNLVKWYGPTLAVDDISFNIEKGQIVGFLGPNGAGKSTTLRILTGYIPPTSGTAKINNHDVLSDSEGARESIGYLPESTPLYLEMRVEEYLHYRGKLMGMTRHQRNERIKIVCDRCGLAQNQRRLIGQLSKGNRQRVGLAQSLLHDPPVLILDEPTAGLDPNQIGEVRKLIGELKGDHTIILSSHILPEVEKVADRVIIIAGGSIRADGTPAELRQHVTSGARIRVEVRANPESVEKSFRGVTGVNNVETTMNDDWCQALVSPNEGNDVRGELGEAALKNGWPIREIRYESASLEQFFVQITADQDTARATDVA